MRPPETTSRPPETTVVEGGVSTAAQDYTIQSGDYPLKVANQFGVTVDELVAFNEWGSVDEFPFPGTVIKIPPGATVPPAADHDGRRRARRRGSGRHHDRTGVDDPRCRRQLRRRRDTIVEAGDIPSSVAKKYDVTVDALQRGERQQSGLQPVHPGPDDHHPRQGRLLTVVDGRRLHGPLSAASRRRS